MNIYLIYSYRHPAQQWILLIYNSKINYFNSNDIYHKKYLPSTVGWQTDRLTAFTPSRFSLTQVYPFAAIYIIIYLSDLIKLFPPRAFSVRSHTHVHISFTEIIYNIIPKNIYLKKKLIMTLGSFCNASYWMWHHCTI